MALWTRLPTGVVAAPGRGDATAGAAEAVGRRPRGQAIRVAALLADVLLAPLARKVVEPMSVEADGVANGSLAAAATRARNGAADGALMECPDRQSHRPGEYGRESGGRVIAQTPMTMNATMSRAGGRRSARASATTVST